MGGSLAPVRVAGFTWNGWQPSAVYALLGHTNMSSTVRYLGVEVEDALEIAESIEI